MTATATFARSSLNNL